MVSRATVAAPVRPSQTVDVPGLGEVVVQAVTLTQRLDFEGRVSKARDAGGGVNSMVCDLLSITVMADDGLSLWSAAEWDAFGAAHPAAVLELFNAAWRVGGFDRSAAEKN